MKKSLKATLKNMYMVLSGILSVLAVIALITMIMGIRPKILTTDSMYPSIYRGSLVLVDVNAAWESIKAGDVIAFRSGSTEVMHRVAEMTDAGLIVRPDNGQGESLVTGDMYAGKEIIAFPFVGGMIKPVLQHRKALVMIATMIMIITGCVSTGRNRTGSEG